MKPNTDVTQALPTNADTAAPHGTGTPCAPRHEEVRGWNRVLAWLGLGCIAAIHPAPNGKPCAPGCVRKPVDRKRRRRAAAMHRPPAPPPKRSAAGSLARKSPSIRPMPQWPTAIFWLCCLCIVAGLAVTAPVMAQFPGGVSPPPQPRYKPKPDQPRAGVSGESHRWYTSALQEYNAKRYGSAMSMLERSIAADADNPSAWYLRGVILHRSKDRAGALGAYNRTLAIDPRYGKAYGDRALLYEEIGHQDLADADWARMRALR
jgi:hypothetical protein